MRSFGKKCKTFVFVFVASASTKDSFPERSVLSVPRPARACPAAPPCAALTEGTELVVVTPGLTRSCAKIEKAARRFGRRRRRASSREEY